MGAAPIRVTVKSFIFINGSQATTTMMLMSMNFKAKVNIIAVIYFDLP